MQPADEFVNLYNRIDEYLRQICKVDNSPSFSSLVSQASEKNAAVRRYQNNLKRYGNFRNIIIHDRAYPKIIAEPTQEALNDFKKLVNEIINPPTLYSLFQRSVNRFKAESLLVDALKYMRENDFSQVVVEQPSTGISLMTVEGIARWVEQQAEEDIISILGVTIGEVLNHEPPEGFRCLSRTATIYDAQKIFTQRISPENPRIFAIVLTETGKRTEKPVGILTPGDLVKHFEELSDK